MTTATAAVLTDLRGRVGVVTLNRPERGNAYTPRMGYALHAALREFDRDDRVRCVIVTGAGRHFCVGADLNRGEDNFKDVERPDQSAAEHLERFGAEKPVIAAINGAAVGIGLTMTLHWDIRIVAEDAKLGLPFVRRGVIAESGAHWLLPRLIGRGRATDLLLTGRLFSGRDAVTLGLAAEACENGTVLERALALAEEIATYCSPAAVRASKRVLSHADVEPSLLVNAHEEMVEFQRLAGAADAREGAAAFTEKRDPRWADT
jgi:enoyl-CoA hydratase/carnithine racemase